MNHFYRPHPKDDGRLCFHRRLSVHICWGRGVSHPADRGVLHARSRWGGGGGTPFQVQTERGGTPTQVWMGGTPSQVQTGGGYPIPGLVGGYPPPHPGLDGIPPLGDSSIVSTCYAAGGMTLAFMQEDFLVDYEKSYIYN